MGRGSTKWTFVTLGMAGGGLSLGGGGGHGISHEDGGRASSRPFS